jgi:Peptidase C10 family/Spi protease inhibitor
MRKSSVFSAILGIILISLFACGTVDGGDDGDDVDTAQTSMAVLVTRNLVSLSEATQLAQAFAKASFGRPAPVIESTDVQADDSTGDPSIYVINIKGGGFVLVSADKRQAPIVAYSDSGRFDLQGVASKLAPEGVRSFVLRARQQTHDIRVGATAPVSNAQEFDRFRNQLSVTTLPAGGAVGNFIVPGPGNCTGSYSHTYELTFPTNWNQDCGWNASAPTASGGPCGHAWAGCVAVAIGQVMKYYGYPSWSFNFGAMSDTSPTTDAAVLLRNIGDRLDMDWGGDSSSADTDDSDDVLESYGYSTSANYTEDFWSKMPTELQWGRPVIMRGTPDCDFFGIPTCGGHAFVITGVYDAYDCGTGSSARHYKVNWGWGGSYNGWYISLNPAGQNYNYHQGVVLGIKL